MNTCSSVFYQSLRPGMKVRIRSDLCANMCLPSTAGFDPTIVEDMADMIGQTVTLHNIYSEGKRWWWIVEDGYQYKWPDTAFMPVQKEFNKLLERRWADE